MLKTDGLLVNKIANHSMFVIISLGLLFAVIYGCSFILDKIETKKSSPRLLLYLLKLQEIEESNEEDDVKKEKKKKIEAEPLFSRPLSSALLSLWLQLFPILLIFGMTFIVLSVGEAHKLTNLDELGNSLSAQASGFAIALGLAGLCFIYLTKVIEPRIDYKQSKNEEVSWFNVNIEISLIVILVICALMLFLFGIEISTAIFTTKFITFSMFIICCLISSSTLGYATYFKGIVNTTKEVEEKMQVYSLEISYSSFPNLRSIIRTDREMRNQLRKQIENLQKLINEKTKMTDDYFSNKEKPSNQVSNTNRKQNTSWNEIIKNFVKGFSRSEYKEHYEEKRRSATVEEKKEENHSILDQRFPTFQKDMDCLPEFAAEVEDLKGQLKTKQIKLVEFEFELKEKQEERTYYIRKIKEEGQTLIEKVHNWRKIISFLNREQFKEIGKLYKLNQQEIVDLQDGYNLALWFLKNGGKP